MPAIMQASEAKMRQKKSTTEPADSVTLGAFTLVDEKQQLSPPLQLTPSNKSSVRLDYSSNRENSERHRSGGYKSSD